MEEMLKNKVIQPAPEGSEWTSPIVLVKKKDGSTRFCIDYRKVNLATRKFHYPLPRIETMLENLQGCDRFFSLDLKSAYHQLVMSPDAQLKGAFVLPGFGVHVPVTLSFGLTRAPASYQRLMEQILPIAKDGDLNSSSKSICLAYLDDITVPSKGIHRGMDHLDVILETIEKENLKLHPKKCCLL